MAGALLVAGAGCSVMVDTSDLNSGSTDAGLTSSPDAASGPQKTGAVSSADATTGGSNPGESDAAEEGAIAPGDDAGGDVTPADAGGPASDDAASEGAASEAGVDSGSPCGPVDTTANCGSCGAACSTTTGAPSCNGTTCSYSCNAGRADCDLGSPDTNGCECATPACCGSSCQTTHTDGVGQSYYDCTALRTFGPKTAIEACVAYAKGDASRCSSGWTCSGDSTQYVCFATQSGSCADYCWGYTGGNVGQVVDCSCPGNHVGSWN